VNIQDITKVCNSGWGQFSSEVLQRGYIDRQEQSAC